MRAYLAQLGRSMFHHDDDAPPQAERYWAVMHIDADGVLQNTTVSVVAVHPGLRSVTVRREADEQDVILRVSKIVEAIDLRTGRRIDLSQWLSNAQR
jgi:hypothetical protein